MSELFSILRHLSLPSFYVRLDRPPRRTPGDPIPLRWLTGFAITAVAATTLGIVVMLAAPAVPPLPVEREGLSDVFTLGLGLTAFSAPISLIAFILWFHRAYGNVSKFHATDHRPSYVLWCWFVPWFFLFRPPQMLREVLANSRAVPPASTRVIGLWWVSLLLGGVLLEGQITAFAVDSVHEDAAAVTEMLGAASFVIAGVALVRIIWSASRAQRDRLERLADPPPTNPLLAGLR